MSSEIAIRVENLSKLYRLGQKQERYKTLRDTVTDMVRSPFRKAGSLLRADSATPQDEDMWALRDVSFEVKRGEVIGIIGRNGAGKSTLLKILSRITEPTSGSVDLFGRVGCLLEVGSGFHPELTGRENVFLNGAILGMRRAEILSKFDEIVSFADVGRFVDTPVKRYSSGMYLRLAFAVAAHMQPEILIIDEVLAVGDFDFQNKCLGKMKDVANSGRTVLFVSHNMGAVQHLCDRAILLNSGRITHDAPAAETVAAYLRSGQERQGARVWRDPIGAPGFDGIVTLRAIRALDAAGCINAVFDVGDPIVIEVEYEVSISKYSLNVHLYFRNEVGQTVFLTMDNLDSPWRETVHPAGVFRAQCVIPNDFLNEGLLRIEYLICTRPTTQHYVTVPDALSLEIFDRRLHGAVRGNWTRDWPNAAVRPRLHWRFNRSDIRPLG